MRSIALLAILSILMVSSAVSSGNVEAETLSIDVTATGAEENPAVESPGRALTRFTFDTETNELTYAVTVSGISQTKVTAAHIHLGADGTNGPVVYPLSLEPFSQVAGSISLTEEDVANLAAGDLYVNVHSLDHPGGFARAQIIFPGLIEEPAPIMPPSTGDGGLVDGSKGTNWLGLSALLVLVGAASGLSLSRLRG